MAKNDSIPVSTTDTINWMLARVLQAAGIEAKTSMVHEESRMNCNMKSRVTLSTSPTGEQLFSRLSSSDIIRHTSDAVLAGSTPAVKSTPLALPLEANQNLKHEATRYERAEGLSTSIKNPNETRNQRAFFFMLTCSDLLARLISELNFYFFRPRKFSNIVYYSWKSQNVQPTF